MRGELPRVKTDAGNPSLHQARVLPCRQRSIRAASARKQNLPRLATAAAQIRVERLPRLLGQFETHRPTRFPLAHVGAVDCVAVRRHIIDTQCDKIASAQFAIDRQIEEGQVAYTQLNMQLGPNGPDMSRSQWRPWPDDLVLVPG
jgi:hypothetical protein